MLKSAATVGHCKTVMCCTVFPSRLQMQRVCCNVAKLNYLFVLHCLWLEQGKEGNLLHCEYYGTILSEDLTYAQLVTSSNPIPNWQILNKKYQCDRRLGLKQSSYDNRPTRERSILMAYIYFIWPCADIFCGRPSSCTLRCAGLTWNLWSSELKVCTWIALALENVRTNRSFSTPSCFRLGSPHMRDRRTMTRNTAYEDGCEMNGQIDHGSGITRRGFAYDLERYDAQG